MDRGDVAAGRQAQDDLTIMSSASSSGSSMSPPFLRGEEDYPSWKKSMRALLEWQGLWTVVEKEPAGGAAARSVISIIGGSANDNGGADELQSVASSAPEVQSTPAQQQVMQAKTNKAYLLLLLAVQKCEEAKSVIHDVPQGNPHEIWSRLEQHYESLTEANKAQLLSELYDMRMKPGESVALYSARMKKIVMQLEGASLTIQKEQVIYQLIRGLETPKFEFARQMLYGMSAVSTQTFEQVCAYLRAQEVQMAAENKAAKGRLKAVIPVNFGGSSGGNKKSGDKSNITCFNCNKKGHMAAECRSKSKKPNGSSQSSKHSEGAKVFCTYCGMNGHEESVCKVKKRAAERMSSANLAAHGSGQARPPAAATLGASAARGHSVSQANFVDSKESQALNAVKKKPRASPKAPAEQGGEVWYLDSGAARNNAKKGTPIVNSTVNRDIRITVANGEVLKNPREGELVLYTPLADRPLHLRSVLVHDQMKANLLSVGETCDSDEVAGVWMDKHGGFVLTHDGDVLLQARRVDGAYVIDECTYGGQGKKGAVPSHPSASPTVKAFAAAIANGGKLHLWHCRLAHMGLSGVERLQSTEAVKDLGTFTVGKESHGICGGCAKGKAHRAPLGKGNPPAWARAKEPMDLWDADVYGPLPPTLGGKRFLYLVTDRASDKTFGFTLKAKSDVAAVTKELCVQAKTLQGRTLKEFHSDGGGEFCSKELLDFFKEQGTRPTITMPATPQHNGSAERKGRTILELVRSMLHHAGAPPELWGEAALTAVHVRNLASIQACGTKTPNQRWYPKGGEMQESVKHLRVFGCDAWVHIRDDQRTKLDAKARLCIFVGYDDMSDVGYRFYDVEAGTILRSRDAQFDERSFTQCAALKQILLTTPDGTAVPMESQVDFDRELNRTMEEADLRLGILLSQQEEEARLAREAAAGNPSTVEGVNEVPPPRAAEESEQKVSDRQPDSPPSARRQDPLPLRDHALIYQESVDGDSDDDRESLYQPDSESADSENDVFEDMVSEPEPEAEPERRYPLRSNRTQQPSHKGKVRWQDIGSMLVALAAKVEKKTSTADSQLEDPKTLKEALEAPDADLWQEGIAEEHASLKEKGVLEEVDRLPPGKKAISTKYAFRRKPDINGEVGRRKVRLVVRGFVQRPSIDYQEGEIYAPTLHSTTLRVLLATVAALDLELKQMDVKTAFLNATLKEEVYVTLPQGAKESLKPNGKPRVFRCKKSLYGLKQAPREWNEELNHTLTKKCGLQRLVTDSCLYVKKGSTGRPIYMAVFVDDLLLAYDPRDAKEAEQIKKTLTNTYTMSDLGNAALVLGMRITRDRCARTLTLDQEVYIRKVLKACGMENCTPLTTPEDPNTVLTKEGSKATKPGEPQKKMGTKMAASLGLDTDANKEELGARIKERYASCVGYLMYAATMTRPDIQHAVSQLSRFVSDPKLAHWRASQRVMCYLQGCPTLGLTFRGTEQGVLGIELHPVFSDANWARDLDDRRSTTGILAKINGCAVAWTSRKQKCVSNSSTEAEYYALGDATKELLWLRQLLGEMGFPPTRPTVLLGDNEAANITTKNDVHHSRLKHIDIKHHFIREHVDKEMVIRWVPSEMQQADMLTKALGRNLFNLLRAKAMGHHTGLDEEVKTNLEEESGSRGCAGREKEQTEKKDPVSYLGSSHLPAPSSSSPASLASMLDGTRAHTDLKEKEHHNDEREEGGRVQEKRKGEGRKMEGREDTAPSHSTTPLHRRWSSSRGPSSHSSGIHL